MNEQAIIDSYNLFVQTGYKKSIDEFKQLLSSNPNAVSDSYTLFQQNGYKKSLDEYKNLMGVSSTPEDLLKKKDDTTVSPLGVGSSASSESADPEALRFAELATKQESVQDLFKRRGTPLPSQPIEGKRRDEPGYIDPRKKLGMYPTREEADMAINQALTDISVTTGKVPELGEYDDVDYFTGSFGNVLRGFDKVSQTGLGELVDDIGRSFAQGYAQGDLAQASNKVIRSGNEFTEEDVQSLIDKSETFNSLPPSQEFQKYLKTYEEEGKSVWGAVKGLMENPTVLSEVAVSSLVSMATNREAVLAGLGTLAAAFGAGAATGGAAGTFVVPGVGTVLGAAGAGLSAAASALPFAFGAASTVVETGSVFAQGLQEQLGTDENGNPIKPTKENVRAILEDPEKYNKIKNDAILRGFTVGIIDAVGGKLATGVGAKILRSSAAATGNITKTGLVKSLAAGGVIEGAAGGTGEALGQVAIGKPIDTGNVILEIAAEMPGALRSTLMASLKVPTYKINKGKVSAEEIDRAISTMTPEQLAASDIEIYNDFDGRKKLMQDKIVTGAIAAEVREAQPDLNEPTVNAIVDLQKELNKLESNKTQVAKDKAAQIRAEIQNLKENQLPDAVAPTVETTPSLTEELAQSIAAQEQAATTFTDADRARKQELEDGIASARARGITIGENLTNELETLNKKEQDAIQEQAAGQVPVQSGATVSQEVAQGEPQAEPQVTTQAGTQEKVSDIPLVYPYDSVQPIVETAPATQAEPQQRTVSSRTQKKIDKVNEARKKELDEFTGPLNQPYFIGDETGPTVEQFINNKYDEQVNELMAAEPAKAKATPASTAQPQAQPAAAPEPTTQLGINDIQLSFAPSNVINVETGTREDTSGRKLTYKAAETSPVTDKEGTPIGFMTKRSDSDGKLSFTVKDSKERNINKGKAYPTERDARVALVEQVNKQRTKTKENEQVQSKRTGDGGKRRTTVSEITPLQGAPKVQGATGPDKQLVSVAEKYAADNKIELKRQGEYVEVDEDRAKRLAEEYAKMANDPNNPKVKEAYAELIKQTKAQYQALVDAGYKFWFIDLNNPDNIEYISSPYNAVRDLRQNKEMGVFPTEFGFGTDETVDISKNPLLEDTGVFWPSGGLNGPTKPVTANDLFRAVHDAFGHGLEGAGFRARGEENAWQAHVRLFTGPAIGAMTSETRGQNSWVNYGPNGEQNRTATAEETVFADQKVGLMPEFTWTEGRAGDMQATTEPVTAKQAAKEKTPEVDAVIEEDANAEGVLERSLDFLDNASKSIGKRLKTNANDALLGIPLSTLKLAIDAARVLVRAGVALRDAIAKVSKDYNLAAKDVEESLKVVSEQAEKEAAAAMPMSADNVLYSDSDVLPKPEKKASNSSVAKLLQEVAANFWGGSIVTSETITPEQERLITNNGTEETIRAFESSGKNAANWYSKAIETAVAVAGVIHPELSSVESASKIEAFAKEKDPVKAAQMTLRMALAITSQNLNVDANTTYAEEQFNYFIKNGKFDPSKEYGAKAPAISSNLKLANLLIDKLGLNGAENFVSQDFTVNQLEEAFQKATGKKVKISGLRNDDVNGAAIFGPKIGQGFLQNLMGKFDPVTIDLWMRRTWGRWTGDVVGTGITDERMATLIQAVNDGVKNKEIPKSLIPKEFFQYKPIQEKRDKGNLYWTMNDKFNERIENDLEFVDVLNKFTKELTRQANNLYKAVHDIPMSKELYDKFLSGELSYFQTANKLLVIRESMGEKYTQYAAKERANKNKPLNKAEWIASQDEKAKRTFSPTNKELSERKPKWGNAAKNIVVDLNPIDIPSNLDRRVITRVVNNIKKNVNARGYNVTNADVQALLWYPEKDIWAKLRGEDESILKLSYDDQFIKIAKERGLGKQAEAVAEDIRGRRTESDVRKDDRRTDGKISSRVDELAEIDVKTPNNAEIVINFLDGVDKAIAKVLKTQANDVLLAIPLTAIRGMIKGIKALVETGVKLRDAINRIAAENNITQEKLKDILDLASIQEEFNTLMNKADKLIANQKLKNIPEKKIVSNLDTMVRKFYENLDINDAQRKLMEREARARMGVEPRKAASIGRVIGVLKDITNVTRQEKLKIISRIRELGKDVGKELAKEIRAMKVNGQITTTQATNIISRLTNINPLNETSVSNFVDYMAEVFAKVKETNRQFLLRDLVKLVSAKAKTAKTESGKRRSKGLDSVGQAFFDAIKPIIKAAANNDVETLQKIKDNIDNDLIQELMIKTLNGQELTTRERVLLDQALAYDTFADLATMNIEQIQELYNQLKDKRTESIANLKSKRIERAEQVKAMHEDVDAQIKAGYSALYNEDGKLKDNNELRDDVKDIWNSFNKLKVWDGVKKLFGRYDFSVATSVFDFMRKNMLHIGTLSKILDKGGKFFTDNVYRALNNMDEKNLKGYFNQRDILDEMANKIEGIKKGFKEFKFKMSNEVITLDNIINTKTEKKRSTTINQDEAMRIYALYKNPVQREKLIRQGFDEVNMKKIEDFIGPKGKQMVDMVVEYFSGPYYESVNNVYRQVNDVSLGYVENYFPTQTISTGVDADMIIDGNFNGIFDAETAPSLKERTDTTGDVELGANFTSVVDNHIQTMERYKAYAEGVKKINSIFKSPSVQALLGEYGTNLSRVYKSLINFSINPNGGAKIEQSILEKVMTKFTGFALSYKLIQIPKQATSFITAFEKYNYRGEGKKRIPGVDTVMFIIDMAKVIATLPSQVKKAQQISASFKDRLEKGLEGDVYGLESGGRVFRPISKSNTIWGKIARAFKKGGAGPTVIGDVLGVMGYMINYNRNIANGMSEADALEVFNDYNATQQSRRAADKIPLQQSQNALARSFTMFGSTTFLQINKAVQGVMGIMTNLQAKKMPKAEDMRAVALNVALGNAFFVLASNMAMLIKGDDEDKEKALDRVFEALIGLNLIYQVPLIGGAVEVAVKKAKGDRSPTSDVINPYITVFNKIYKGVKEDDIIKSGQPIVEIVLGTQVDQFVGLFNILGGDFDENNIYDMVGITKSFRPGGSEPSSSDKKDVSYEDRLEKDLLEGYENKTEMKRYEPELYEQNFGEGSEYYELTKEEKEEKKEAREEEQKEKDAEYGYKKDSKGFGSRSKSSSKGFGAKKFGKD